jgi:hypothetical protein
VKKTDELGLTVSEEVKESVTGRKRESGKTERTHVGSNSASIHSRRTVRWSTSSSRSSFGFSAHVAQRNLVLRPHEHLFQLFDSKEKVLRIDVGRFLEDVFTFFEARDVVAKDSDESRRAEGDGDVVL